MRRLWVLVCLAACTPEAPAFKPKLPNPDQGDTTPAKMADEDNYQPTYGKNDLEKALIGERGKEATEERTITELEARGLDLGDDQMREASNNIAVRRRFIAALEACQTTGRTCPPRLDEPAWTFEIDDKNAKPPLDTALRFDLDSWQKVAAELHGRACACRTMACVDSVGVAIDQLESRPMTEIQGDETASQSLTRARECLYRLRGRAPQPRPQVETGE